MAGKERSNNGEYVETTTPEDVLLTMRDAESPFVTVGDVAEAIKCSRETARRKLTELHDSGDIERREIGASATQISTEKSNRTPQLSANAARGKLLIFNSGTVCCGFAM